MDQGWDVYKRPIDILSLGLWTHTTPYTLRTS